MSSAQYKELGFAKTEPLRIQRQGFPEAIFCPGKTDDQVLKIFGSLLKGPGPVLATRVPDALGKRLVSRYPGACHDTLSRLVVAKTRPKRGKKLLVVSAGTADLPVAEEAAQVAEALGARVERLYDVGVSGIHRLLSHKGKVSCAAAVIVCAGMEGALPSVVGGLASCPVIAVPTSVGYGAHLQGIAPLLTMLNSCASNVSVVNIDNGFSAGVIASLITR